MWPCYGRQPVRAASRYVPTVFVTLTIDDAERLFDRPNARLGLDRDAWSGKVARSIAAARSRIQQI